jgi:hypothetical protein
MRNRSSSRLLPWVLALTCVLLVDGTRASAQVADDREDIEITVFTGISIDSFAAQELRKYINKDDSGDVREQLVAGFDFSYRINKPKSRNMPVFWLYGETVHGVRSGEANCEGENQTTELCETARLEPAADPNAPLAIFRKATTLEAFFGLRAELVNLRSADDPGAAPKLYVKGQLGLLTVAGRGGDVVDMHHGGVGVLLTRGPFRDSYFEIGYGTNGLFLDNPRRWKVDGFLSMGPDDAAVRPFAQMTVDADFKDGPDSIQSYFGFDIDVRKIWK